jgi:hypothetical protein
VSAQVEIGNVEHTKLHSIVEAVEKDFDAKVTQVLVDSAYTTGENLKSFLSVHRTNNLIDWLLSTTLPTIFFTARPESKSTFDVRVIIGVPAGCVSVECMFAKTAMDAP